jgi:arylsulfatase A-like enzyme
LWNASDEKDVVTDPANVPLSISLPGSRLQRLRPAPLKFFRWIVVGWLGSTLLAGCGAPAPPDTPPPILIICSDTHRFDYSVAYEGPALMPRLTALRERAVLYRHAWSNASWTLPAVTSVFTGMTPSFHHTGRRHHIGSTEELKRRGVSPGHFVVEWGSIYHEFTTYPPTLESLPEILARSGYWSALVSANPFLFVSGLASDGFTETSEHPGGNAEVLNANVARLLDLRPLDRPILMAVHYTDVHEFALPFDQELEDGVYEIDEDRLRRAYAGAAARLDTSLGHLLDLWDGEVGLDESVVIFYSDHGEHLLDPGHPDLATAPENIDDGLPPKYRRLGVPALNHGNSMQESLLRIPLVVKYPDKMGLGGRVEDATVSLIDLLPTLLELAGRPVDELVHPAEGRSLLTVHGSAERLIFADNQLYGAQLGSVRRGADKLVIDERTGEAVVRHTCVDCRPDGDPGDVVSDERVQRELIAAFRAHHVQAEFETSDLGLGRRASPAEAEELRALGYAE